MKNSAKKEKKAAAKNLGETLERINTDVEAGRALKKIVKGRGCDESELLDTLFAFCGGTEEQVRDGFNAAVAFKDEAIRLGKQLEDDAVAIKKLMALVSPELVDAYKPQGSLLSEMKKYGEFLSRIGRSREKSLKNVRLGSGDTVNLTAGRTHHLMELVYLVTSDAEPTLADFKLIAALVGAVLHDERRTEEIADNLRNRFKTYNKASEQSS
jgi:hypothetical protein